MAKRCMTNQGLNRRILRGGAMLLLVIVVFALFYFGVFTWIAEHWLNHILRRFGFGK